MYNIAKHICECTPNYRGEFCEIFNSYIGISRKNKVETLTELNDIINDNDDDDNEKSDKSKKKKTNPNKFAAFGND